MPQLNCGVRRQPVRVALSLTDPWDMGEALGWPTILASVIHRSANSWLVEVIEPFTYADTEYRFIVVSARHAESLSRLQLRRRCPVT